MRSSSGIAACAGVSAGSSRHCLTPPRAGATHARQHEFRAALRLFMQAPWFAAGAVVTLALGIGATTAIFSLADATLLRPLPFPDAERVLVTKFSWSMLDFRDYASRQGSFTDVAAWAGV